ncbi:LEC protein, partial [Atractosteus spatula]|nr:LEC protein [Atractosteus spatula]
MCSRCELSHQLGKDEQLRKGDYLLSENGNFKAIFQDDGNFVVYGWKPVWASNTDGLHNADHLIMQSDSNLVAYKTDGKAMWHTGTYTNINSFKDCVLQLRNDGTLIVERDGHEVWSSAKSQGLKV